MVRLSYGNSNLDSYVRPASTEENGTGSPLRPEFQPWTRGSWDELGEKTNRSGLLGRKIGVVPMWLANGQRVAATMLQVIKLRSASFRSFRA